MPHVELAGPRRDLAFVNAQELSIGRKVGCSFHGPRLTPDNQLLLLYHTEGTCASDVILTPVKVLW